MGINLPPPPVVEFGELPPSKKPRRKDREKEGKDKHKADGNKKPEDIKEKSSSLGPSVKPDSRTVFADDPAANTPFKYGVRDSKNLVANSV